MATQPRPRTFKSLVTGVIAGMLVLGGGVSSASAADADLAESALGQFRANLTSSADVAAFDVLLTAEQQAELSAYLLGEIDPLSSLSDTTHRSGDFELRTTAVSTLSKPNADPSALTTEYVTGNGYGSVTSHGWR